MDPDAGLRADGLMAHIYAAGLGLHAVLGTVEGDDVAVTLRLAIRALDTLATVVQRDALTEQAPTDLVPD